jgi:hypothetical protein
MCLWMLAKMFSITQLAVCSPTLADAKPVRIHGELHTEVRGYKGCQAGYCRLILRGEIPALNNNSNL